MLKKFQGKVKEYFFFLINYLIERRFVICIFIPFFLMDLILRGFICKTDFYPAYYPAPNLFTLGWILMIIGFIMSAKGIMRKILYWVFFGFFFVMFLTQAVYYSYTNFCFSFTSLEMAEEGKGYIMDTIMGTSPVIYVLALLVLAIAVLVFIKLPTGEKFRPKRFVIIFVCFITLHFVSILSLGSQNKELKWNNFKNPKNIYVEFSDYNKCMKITGLYEYTIRNIYVTYLMPIEQISSEDKSFLDNMYTAGATTEKVPETTTAAVPDIETDIPESEGEQEEYTDNDINAYTGILEGKNVIFLQLEGVDDWLLTEETMPNLYALQQQAVNFTQHYSMYTGGGSTFNSEFAVNTGFITPVSYNQNVYNLHTNTFSQSMPRLFKNQGYTVNAFHMNSGEFYSRSTNYRSWGYDKYYGLQDIKKYTDDSYKLDRELILNETFYDAMFKQEGKFVDYIITYSPHTPFTTTKEVGKLLAEEKYGAGNVPELTEEECAKLQAGETDYFVGLLIDALVENGLYENTVIVAYADHYLYTLNDKTILDQYKTTENNLINHTPFFIWSSNLAHFSVDKVTMQTNILPTVLNLFGIEYNKNNYIGSDALDSEYHGYAFFSDYSWYDGNVYVEDGVITNGQVAEESYVQEMGTKIRDVIMKNDLTLRYDYLKYYLPEKESEETESGTTTVSGTTIPETTATATAGVTGE